MLTLASKFTAPHSIGSSASLSASALVGGGGGGGGCGCGPGWRPRWWRVEGIITGQGRGLQLAEQEPSVLWSRSRTEERRRMLNQEETLCSEPQYGRLVTRKGLSCVN